MNMYKFNLAQRKYSDLEIFIAKLYLYLLPIRMISPLIFLKNMMPGAAIYFDIFIHFIGVILIVINSKGRMIFRKDPVSQLMHYFAGMVIFFNISSFIMAIVMQIKYGNYASESAFSGISGMVIYYFQYAFIIFYNKHIFQMISKEEISKIIQRVCLFLLILGYWQIAILTIGGVFRTTLINFDVFSILYPGDGMYKLSLTGSEGASAGNLIGIFVLPFLLSKILTKHKKTKYIIQILLWLPVIYFTQSTTAYILLVIDLIVYSIVALKNFNKKSVIFLLVCILLCIIFILFLDNIFSFIPTEIRVQIQYLLIEKSSDENNGSTVSRMVPLVTNWGAFTEYPLLGVGNGLQGYFYIKYFPSWAYNVPGSDVMTFYNIAKNTIVNGALFFPSILSGYGIVGIILFFVYIIKSNRIVLTGKKQLRGFYYFYKIACFAILFSGFQGDFTGHYCIWFVLSIPYMINCNKEETRCETATDFNNNTYNEQT